MNFNTPLRLTAAAPVLLSVLSLIFCCAASAKDAQRPPAGFKPLAEAPAVIKQAAGRKLITLVVKGMDDNCPRCAKALKDGVRAAGANEKLFARAETIRQQDATTFTDALKERIGRGFTFGASVHVIVFSPDMTRIVAEADRGRLEQPGGAEAFKKEVEQARKAL